MCPSPLQIEIVITTAPQLLNREAVLESQQALVEWKRRRVDRIRAARDARAIAVQLAAAHDAMKRDGGSSDSGSDVEGPTAKGAGLAALGSDDGGPAGSGGDDTSDDDSEASVDDDESDPKPALVAPQHGIAFAYSTPPDDCVSTMLAAFDAAVASVADVPDIEPAVMSKLFWSERPKLRTLTQSDELVAQQRCAPCSCRSLPPPPMVLEPAKCV